MHRRDFLTLATGSVACGLFGGCAAVTDQMVRQNETVQGTTHDRAGSAPEAVGLSALVGALHAVVDAHRVGNRGADIPSD